MHELKYQPGHYERIYVRTAGSKKPRCVRIGASYTAKNGAKLSVVSLFEGPLYQMVNYQTGKKAGTVSAPLHWFANQIS